MKLSPRLHHPLFALVLLACSLIGNTAPAQDSTASLPAERGREWLAPLAIAVSAAADPEVREWALGSHSHFLDQVAQIVNPLGTARVLVPAMVVSWGAGALTHHDSVAHGVVKTAVAYVASDLAESALKSVIGRERPHVTGNSHRFHPFTGNGDWHSMRSAHVTHIASIAQSIAMQVHSGPVNILSQTLVGLVGLDRVYEDQHWTSDVAVSVVLTNYITRATLRWLNTHTPWH